MYDVQAQMGASFTSFWGWVWTESFGDVEGEYRALRHNVGAADVSSLIQWEWSGPDALAAAQRLCTNDILGLEVGQIRYGPFLNDSGRIVDDGTIYRLGDTRCWVMTNRWDLQEHFATVSHGLDVHIKDVTLEMAVIQVQGPASRDLLARLTSADLASLRYFRFSPEPFEFAGIPAWLSRTGFTGELGYELFVAPDVAPELWSHIVDAGARPYGTAVADIQRIESGIVVYELDYAAGERTPYDVSFDRFVSLDRDFVGREAIGDLAAHPPRRLMSLRIDGDLVPERNDRIFVGERDVGVVTSPTRTFDYGVVALAIVDADVATAGQAVEVASATDRSEATVATTPIYDPERRRPFM
jgi:aminomethyltransferase